MSEVYGDLTPTNENSSQIKLDEVINILVEKDEYDFEHKKIGQNIRITFTKEQEHYYDLINNVFFWDYDSEYDSPVKVNISQLIEKIDEIKSWTDNHPESRKLYEFVKKYIDETVVNSEYKDNLEKGLILFKDIPLYFKKEDLITIQHNEYNNEFYYGGKIKNLTLYKDTLQPYYVVTFINTVSDGICLREYQMNTYIDSFSGLQSLNNFTIRKMNDKDKEILIQRFDKYSKYLFDLQYVYHKGFSYRNSNFKKLKLREIGRIMIDYDNFINMNPNYNLPKFDDRKKKGKIIASSNQKENDETKLIFYPVLFGFSFNNKSWNEFFIENISDIVYDETAFDTLVLDQNKKDVSKALVLGMNSSFTDIIQGKSGGIIFLLHGSPGTGKTLTCESIAELLKKPLYNVSVGELGTDPVTLESRLTKILEICSLWNAIILFDEADIFLEKRTVNDIHRNAMVGIFLRLLERNQGVIFLTTNRASTIDEAFKSRISVTFEYKDLNQETRVKIWNNLLSAAKFDKTKIDINILSKFEINGRQIKNAMRIAQTLSQTYNKELNTELFVSSIAYME
jgi:Cdc6-like AAA superfamily ATPase